jgi:histone H1/5
MLLTSPSRVALKKYVKANNQLNVSESMFDALFNKAIRTGVEKGVFEQPKGMCCACIQVWLF